MWTIEMEPSAIWTLPAASKGLNRMLYFFRGDGLRIADTAIDSHCGIRLQADAEVTLDNGDEPAELLLLQGRPIGEPVVHHGPFVMNEATEIKQAVADFRRSEFGGWPWPSDEPVHARSARRFAIHADGRKENG